MRVRVALVSLAIPVLALGAQSEWPVDRKPLLDVMGVAANGSVNFEIAGGATRLSDGSLLVADRGPNSIRVFDRMGKLVKTVGRTGDGPGEFRSILWAGGCGRDTMLVWDLQKRRANVVDASGSVVRQFQIPADSASRVRRPLNTMACGARGTIAYISDPTSRLPGATPEIMLMFSSAVTVSKQGQVISQADSVPSGEWYLTVSPSGGRGAFPRPLGISPSIAIVGSRTYVGVSDSARIIVFDSLGHRSVVPIPVQPRPPTRDEFDASLSVLAGMANPSMRQAITDQLSKAPMPSLAPAYSALFSDPAGLLWVQTSPVGAKQSALLAIQPDGRVVARATLPLPLTVNEIGRDYILGTYTDANDETHIAVLRLNRR